MRKVGAEYASRARAHLRHAKRYSDGGDHAKAMAHINRGLEYARRASSFGTGTDLPSGDGRVDTKSVKRTDQIDLGRVRASVRAVVAPMIAQVDGLDELIANADLDTLCSLLVTKLSPGYDAAALMAAALVWNRRWKGTSLSDHADVRSTIERVIEGNEVFTGAHFGEMRELFVFTDVSLRSTSGTAKGDIDDKFALCLLAHAARASRLERIVVLLSARQKADDDITMPRDVANLFTEKLKHPGMTTMEQLDESVVKVTYGFDGKESKKPSRGELVLEVCFDHGIAHLRPSCEAVKTFDAIMTPTRRPAVAVVIGPISVRTAEILESGSGSADAADSQPADAADSRSDAVYALVAGVSVKGGVNGGESKMNGRFGEDGAAWDVACKGGANLKTLFELTTGDTRRLLMTLPFLAKHNIASVDEVKEAHASVWRNHLGFYTDAKPDMAFRILASNSQTTSAHGPDAAARLMRRVFEAARAKSDVTPEELFEYTQMRQHDTKANPRYVEIAERYVAWCFANLYLQLMTEDGDQRRTVVRRMEDNGDLDVRTLRALIARMTATKEENKDKIIRQVTKDVCGAREEGDETDLWGVYVTSIVATYMRLLSTELLLNQVGLFDRITWTGKIERDSGPPGPKGPMGPSGPQTGLYKLKPEGQRKTIVSVE